MSKAHRALATIGLAVSLALSPALAPAARAETGLGAKIFDASVVRPLRATSVLIGAVFFVPAIAFAMPFGGTDAFDQAYEKLIGEPYEATFVRPLGEF